MRQIREVLRLAHEAKLGRNQIVKAMSLSQGAVSNYLQRAARAGLAWPLPSDLDDSALERLLLPPQKVASECVFARTLFSYIRSRIDAKPSLKGRWLLTGSQEGIEPGAPG